MRIESENPIDQAKQKEKPFANVGISTSFESTVQKKEDEFKKGTRNKDVGYDRPDAAQSVVEDIEQEFEQKMDVDLRKDQMAVLAQTTSPEDYRKMQEDGFSVNDMDTRAIVTVTDKIKVQLAKAGVDVSCMGDDLSTEQLEKIGGNVSAAVSLAKKMQAADIPVTEDNLQEGVKALEQTNELHQLNEGAVKYLLDKNLPPTLENIYTAQYCGSESYTNDQKQEIDFEAIKKQVEQVIVDAGYPVNQETLSDSAWMLENDIALTKDNFSYMQKLEGLCFPVPEGEVADAVVLAITEGGRPTDAMLLPEYSLTEQAKQAVDIVTEATDADLAYLVSNGLELTVENLKYAIEGRKSGRIGVTPIPDNGLVTNPAIPPSQPTVPGQGMQSNPIDPADNVNQLNTENAPDEMTLPNQITTQQLAFLTAKRQLEETRLAMTVEANLSLLKRGIAIDTKPLEELVAKLKSQEESYYSALVGQGQEIDHASAGLFEETNQKVSELKSVPAYVLGMGQHTLSTVNSLHEAGTALKDTFEKASQSYETLMTSPRSDLGDSIQKAFANVDDILEDLNMDKSEPNQRAVRILAYNSLEINPESIEEMKAADEKVQRTFSNLTPATVKELISKGVNPLDMNLEELNQMADQIRQQSGEPDEKFSEYLWKLEQNNEISQEERDSYIGIYRLIHQIEMSDGAAIGAIVSQGADLTMRNLLTAVRSAKKGSMDYTVDDDFSGIDSVNGSTKSITDQIDAAYQQNCIKDILDSITPATFQKLTQNPEWENFTPEQMKAEMERIAALEVEKETAENREYAKSQLENFTVAATSDTQVYRLLSEYHLPNTLNYVLAANRFTSQRSKVFNQLFNSDEVFSGEAVDFKEIQEQILEQFSDAMESPESLAEAYKALADTAENAMKTMIADKEHITSMDIREMKLTCTQLSIAGRMAEEENYAIPVLIGDEVTNVSLKIVRGKENKGFVDIMFESLKTGKVAATFDANGKGVSGVAATDNENTKKFLEENAAMVEEKMRGFLEEGDIRLNVVYAGDLNLEQYSENAAKSHGKTDVSQKDSAVQTTGLYGIAKSFIETVKELAKQSDI